MKARLLIGFASAALMITQSVMAQSVTTSVSIWTESFRQAVDNNRNSEISNLLNFKQIESKVVPASLDLKIRNDMKQARIDFEKADFKSAEKIYNDIPKASDYWLEAVEERGWSAFRQENFENAMAQTKTLLSPQFASIINAEAFLLQSLSQLQICDYEGVLNTHNLFKEKQKERISKIQDLVNTGSNEALNIYLEKVDTFPTKAGDFTEVLSSLPLLFYRDLQVQKATLNYKLADAGLKIIEESGLNLSSRKQLQKNKRDSYNRLKNRIKQLAQAEVNKTFKVIQKLNLVEVEAIQRIHTDLDIKEQLYSKSSDFKKVDHNKLVFMDDGRPWIDELDKYEVKTKACDTNIRRKM